MDTTGEQLNYVSLYPQSGAGGWAIAGNSFYYPSNGLYKRDFDGTASMQLLSSTDSSYGGAYYGVGNRLFSVKSEYISATQSFDYYIREHSTSTGAITKELTSFSLPFSANTQFYDGETALYVSVFNDASNSYDIYKINNGDPEPLINVELTSGETGLGRIDESNGYLIIPGLSSGDTSISVYNLNTQETQEVIVPRDKLAGTGLVLARAEYIMLNPQ